MTSPYKPDAGPGSEICKHCILKKQNKDCHTPYMRGAGMKKKYTEVRVLAVGEAPGRYEDEAGIPFSPKGASGNLLRETLKKFGVKAEDVIYTNTVRCRPPNNKIPGRNPVKQCQQFLHEEIEACRPGIILSLGKTAANGIFKDNRALKAVRRQVLEYTLKDGTKIPVVPCYHPSFAVRDTNNRPAFEDDIKFFMEAYTGKHKAYDPHETARERFLGKDDERCDLNASPRAMHRFFTQAVWAGKTVAFDYETNSKTPYLHPDFRVTCFGVSDGEHTLTMRMDTPDMRLPDSHPKVECVKAFLKNANIKKVAHLAKYEMNASRVRFGVRPKGIIGCTLLLHTMVCANEVEHNLDAVNWQLLGIRPYNAAVNKYTKNSPRDEQSDAWLNVPWDVLAPYCALDCCTTWHIWNIMLERLKEEDRLHKKRRVQGIRPSKLYHGLIVPSMYSLHDMEYNGLQVDAEYARELGKELAKRIEKFRIEARSKFTYVREYEAERARLAEIKERPKLAGGRFNPGSNPQVADILFDPEFFALTPEKEWRTDVGNLSVSDPILQKIKERENEAQLAEFIDFVLAFRSTTKDKGTYVDGILRNLSSDSRVHPSFHQDTASTGRLSCKDPNLQNVKKTPELRRMYVPREGFTLINADYSQIELRVLAVMSGDDDFLEIFAHGEDLHEGTARRVFNVKKVSKELRRQAKTVNFGIVYLISPHGLANRLGITQAEAEDLINLMYTRFPGIEEWQLDVKDFAVRHGCVYTLTGRKRILENCRLKVVNHETRVLQEEALRAAVNMPVQGTASDMCLFSYNTLNRGLTRYFPGVAFPVDIVHDSIMVEARDDCVEEVSEYMVDIMTTEPLRLIGKYWDERVPIIVDVSTGKDWAKVEEEEDEEPVEEAV